MAPSNWLSNHPSCRMSSVTPEAALTFTRVAPICFRSGIIQWRKVAYAVMHVCVSKLIIAYPTQIYLHIFTINRI